MQKNYVASTDKKTVGLITYRVLCESDEIGKYVVQTCETEWDPDDFRIFGKDLYDQRWDLQTIETDDITVQESLLASPAFMNDVTPRIERQHRLHNQHIPIPPLILRGSDHLIFDGYARWHFFKAIGVQQCLAYISG